jgi:hypothetical protein
MRKLSILILIIPTLAYAQILQGIVGGTTPAGGAPITVVGTPTGTIAASYSDDPVLAPATTHTAGHTLAVFVASLDTPCPTYTINNTATGNDTFTAATTCDVQGTYYASQWFIATNIHGHAADVVQVSNSSPALTSIYVIELNGASASPIDQIAVGYATGTGPGPVVSGAFTTTLANEIILAGTWGLSTLKTYVPESGFTLGTADASSQGNIEYKIVSAIQTGITVLMDWTGPYDNTTIHVLTLKGN